MAGQNVVANLYELRGGGYEITYSASGIDGKPHLNIQRGKKTWSFSGNQISKLSTAIGDLVTVTIETQPDSQTKTFSILVPLVRLAEGKNRQAVSTVGIITTIKTSIGGPALVTGVVQTYSVVALRGAAKAVEFLSATA